VDLADGVALVVLAGVERAELQGVELGGESAQARFELGLDRVVRLLPGQLVEHLEIRQPPVESLQQVDVVPHQRQLGRHLPRLVGVVPERRIGSLLLQLGEPRPLRVEPQVLGGFGQAAAKLGEISRQVSHHPPPRGTRGEEP